MDILDRIAARKRERLNQERERYQGFRAAAIVAASRPYERLQAAAKPFFIAEFKRRSPSAGAIEPDADPAARVQAYSRQAAAAVSVLTEEDHFGGSLADLQTAAQALQGTDTLVLMKDFVIDPLQVYAGRAHGADLILLIARLLSAGELARLLRLAHDLGMGALIEVHNEEDIAKLDGLPAHLVGVNNRDLARFSVRLNRCNALATQLPASAMKVAESGIASPLDVQIAGTHADGFLIGTALMKSPQLLHSLQAPPTAWRFKACGLREPAHLALTEPDLLGVNFSPESRRRIDPNRLADVELPPHAVAVFKGNAREEIQDTIEQFGFRWVQVYAADVDADMLAGLPANVILAAALREPAGWARLRALAPFSDLLILDGAAPGSGQAMELEVPPDFPFPFLLAGGLEPGKLSPEKLAHPRCLGVDIASGIETAGRVDPKKVAAVRSKLDLLTKPALSATE